MCVLSYVHTHMHTLKNGSNRSHSPTALFHYLTAYKFCLCVDVHVHAYKCLCVCKSSLRVSLSLPGLANMRHRYLGGTDPVRVIPLIVEMTRLRHSISIFFSLDPPKCVSLSRTIAKNSILRCRAFNLSSLVDPRWVSRVFRKTSILPMRMISEMCINK